MSTAFLNPVLFLPNRATLSRSQRHKQGRQSPHPAFQTACRKPTLKSGQRKGKIHTTTYLLPATRQQLIIPYLEVPTLSPPPLPQGFTSRQSFPKAWTRPPSFITIIIIIYYYHYYYYYHHHRYPSYLITLLHFLLCESLLVITASPIGRNLQRRSTALTAPAIVRVIDGPDSLGSHLDSKILGTLLSSYCTLGLRSSLPSTVATRFLHMRYLQLNLRSF